jgi:hypothetical protein
MVTAPATGETLVVELSVAKSQSTDYIANDAFPAETHEAALDKLTRQVKELKAIIDYNVPKLPTNILTSTTVTDTDISGDQVFKLNSAGTAVELGAVTTSNIQLDSDTSTSSVDEVGDILMDTDGNGSTVQQGVITAHDGTNKLFYWGSDAYPTTDDQVLAYDSATNKLTWQTLVTPGGISSVVDDTTPQLGGQLDVNGQAIGDGTRELITFTEDGSAVNHINIENEATGSGPIIASAGDDAAIDINISPKSTGNILLNSDNVLIGQDIVHTGDTNNLISFGTDTQDFQTGGSSRMDISDSGVRFGAANARITTVLDEDAMGSDSATALATQQSIKAYVDAATSGLVFLTSATASASSSLDFTTNIDSTYDTYLLLLEGLVPATDGVDLYLRVSTDTGSTFKSGASDYSWMAHAYSTAGVLDAADAQIPLSYTAYNIGNDSGNGVYGHVYLHNPSSSSLWCSVSGESAYSRDDQQMVTNRVSGKYTATTAVDAIRFLFSSGNISSGTVRLYGIVKS